MKTFKKNYLYAKKKRKTVSIQSIANINFLIWIYFGVLSGVLIFI